MYKTFKLLKKHIIFNRVSSVRINFCYGNQKKTKQTGKQMWFLKINIFSVLPYNCNLYYANYKIHKVSITSSVVRLKCSERSSCAFNKCPYPILIHFVFFVYNKNYKLQLSGVTIKIIIFNGNISLISISHNDFLIPHILDITARNLF